MKQLCRICSFLPVVLIALLVNGMGTQGVAGPTTFTSDDFNSFNLKRPLWTYTDPLGDCSLMMQGVNSGNATLTITVPAGQEHDIYTAYNAPRIMQTCANADFQVEVKFVSGLAGVGNESFTEEGVVVEQDGSNVMRFDFVATADSMRAFAGVFQSGVLTSKIGFKGITAINAAPLWLRVKRTTNTWDVSYSTNGSSFTSAGSFTQTLTVSKIGLFAGNAGSLPRQAVIVADYFFNTDATNPTEDGATNVTDTQGPLIHGVRVTGSAWNAAEVSWYTDEPANGGVEYGTSTSYGDIVSHLDLKYQHSLTLTGLAAGTLYDYRITDVDNASNPTTSGNFTTTTILSSVDGISTSDDFNTPSLDTGIWTFQNPRGDATLSIVNKQLSISIPAGVSHDIFTTGNTAPKIMQPISNGNVSLVAKFNSPVTSSSSSYQIQGILVEADSNNMIRFDFSNFDTGTRAFAASFTGGLSSPEALIDNPSITPAGTGPLYMRVNRDGAHWFLDFSLNGTTWTPVGDFYKIINVTKVGIWVGNDGAPIPAFTTLVDFFQAIIPARPLLTYPANGATDIPTPVTFTWDTTSRANTYRLQVASDTLFTNLIFNDSTISPPSKQVTGLSNTTKYFWRVRGKNTEATGSYSKISSFTTYSGVPAVPTLLSPSSGASNQPLSLTLKWSKSSLAATYRIQLATDSTFATGIVVNDSTLTDTTKPVSGLLNNTKYYWRVNAKGTGGTSAFSAASNFTTIIATPSAPSLLSPANGATGQALNLMLRWSKSPNAATYRLQVGTDSTFATGLAINDSTIVDTFKVGVGLVYNAKYFWRVNAKNAGGTSAYSTVSNFRTLTADPSIPVQLFPANGATSVSRNFVFKWTRPVGATSFHLQIGTDSTYATGLFVNDPAVVDTFKAVNGMTSSTKYYWRVNADNVGGTSPYSPVWPFTTGTTDVKQHADIPTEFSLSQNYPNPFNPTTEIEFALPKATSVKLDVYNMLGQRVATLVDETRAAGYHTVQFDAANLPSGIYFYRLQSAEVSFVKKMMIVK